MDLSGNLYVAVMVLRFMAPPAHVVDPGTLVYKAGMVYLCYVVLRGRPLVCRAIKSACLWRCAALGEVYICAVFSAFDGSFYFTTAIK